MVQAGETRDQIRERCKTRFMTTFETMDQHELKIEEENGNRDPRKYFSRIVTNAPVELSHSWRLRSFKILLLNC